MSNMQRRKGAEGQREFASMLRARDWNVIQSTCGIASEDLIATSPDGKQYSIEIKNGKVIRMETFLKQAREQAGKRKLPWMLACRLHRFTRTWLVLRADEIPVVWSDNP